MRDVQYQPAAPVASEFVSAVNPEFRHVGGDATALPAADESDTTASGTPTWKEIGTSITRRLKQSLAHHQSSAKMYAIAAAIVVGVGIIPWPHTVRCNVVCEPVERRFIAAPFDSILLKSDVVIGQQVSEGEVLASLDGSDLRSRLAGAHAKLAQAQQKQLAALSTGDHSQAEFERLEVEHLGREIELLVNRQNDLEIRSPISGFVITGDLERAQGAPLSVGDSLFEIAKLDHLIAEVSVPESEVSFVSSEMPISVTLDSVADRTFDTSVDKIHLRSEIRDNQSVFIAEATLKNDASILRPGMNGSGTIHVGHRSLAWILFHRPCNAVRHWIGW